MNKLMKQLNGQKGILSANNKDVEYSVKADKGMCIFKLENEKYPAEFPYFEMEFELRGIHDVESALLFMADDTVRRLYRFQVIPQGESEWKPFWETI